MIVGNLDRFGTGGQMQTQRATATGEPIGWIRRVGKVPAPGADAELGAARFVTRIAGAFGGLPAIGGYTRRPIRTVAGTERSHDR